MLENFYIFIANNFNAENDTLYLMQCPQEVCKHGYANEGNDVDEENYGVIKNILIFSVA